MLVLESSPGTWCARDPRQAFSLVRREIQKVPHCALLRFPPVCGCVWLWLCVAAHPCAGRRVLCFLLPLSMFKKKKIF